MLRRTLALAVLALLAALPARAQTVDQILARNFDALGGLEKIRAVQTMRMTGVATVGPGIEAPIVLEQKRPNQLRMDIVVQGMTITQAYDGKTAWMINPLGGRKDPEPMPEDAMKQVQEQADFDGPLVDYKAKGNQVELAGKEKVEGSDAWKLKVTLKNGEVRYLYLDADQYLVIRTEGKTTVRGTEIEAESTIGDYKEVNGLLVPFAVESGQKGSPQKQKFTIKEVVINAPIDDSRFKMPTK